MVNEVQNMGSAAGAQMPVERQEELWAQPFSGYKVVNILGEGPAGPVLLARDTRFEREVVIKTIVPDLEAHEDAAERFFNEARQVARLRHDNLVRGLDVGRAGKYLYFVMEYIRGETLEKRLAALQTGRIREIEALQHIRQTAAGLQFIFEQGLAHRNLKPANLMLGGGTLKIADFGVARDLAFPDTQTQALHGAEYASPEIAADESNIDIRSDLYSLGCCWYRMILGRAPFTAESPAVLLRRHISDDPVAPHEADPRIVPATSQLIMWLLQKDREKRPRNPQLFLSKLVTHPLLKLAQEKNIIPDSVAAEEDGEGEEDLAGIIYTGPGAKGAPRDGERAAEN